MYKEGVLFSSLACIREMAIKNYEQEVQKGASRFRENLTLDVLVSSSLP